MEDDLISLHNGGNASMNAKQRQELVGRLSAMAEEIANPLTALSVRLHTLQGTLRKDAPEHQTWVAIDHDVQRVQRMLRQFLAEFHGLLSKEASRRKPRG